MMELLTRLNRDEGVTIVMATHSVDLVPIFLHRLHILNRGRIVCAGLPEEVFTTPGRWRRTSSGCRMSPSLSTG